MCQGIQNCSEMQPDYLVNSTHDIGIISDGGMQHCQALKIKLMGDMPPPGEEYGP